eukprot:365219-Chlamydomonas_euryale.AAC.24
MSCSRKAGAEPETQSSAADEHKKYITRCERHHVPEGQVHPTFHKICRRLYHLKRWSCHAMVFSHPCIGWRQATYLNYPPDISTAARPHPPPD